MFTGVVETLGEVKKLDQDKTNLNITLSCPFTHELRINQSIAHNGVCLTVVDIQKDVYTITAIDETLNCSNLGSLKVGESVNLERCLRTGGRLEGHIVQGHVDQAVGCVNIEERNGSRGFYFQYNSLSNNIAVEKGSICVNGVSLTVVGSEEDLFSVAIIPYTYEHTNFKNLKVGDKVNLEFDIVGKYIARLMDLGV